MLLIYQSLVGIEFESQHDQRIMVSLLMKGLNMKLQGAKVTLEPMTKDEIPQFFYWATKSPFWYGEYSDEPIPTYEQFRDEWKDHYFDGSQPALGRSFAVVFNNRTVGQINYNEINRTDKSVDVDIIIYQEQDRGKGYGSDALRALCEYLFTEFGLKKIQLETAVKNERAIASYKKIGFKIFDSYISKGIEFFRMEVTKDRIEATK